jgi:integrase/recombinase XerD
MASGPASASDLALMLASWELALRAERKSPQTVRAYGDGVRRFLTWAEEHDRSPDLDRPTVAAFVADLLDAGPRPRPRGPGSSPCAGSPAGSTRKARSSGTSSSGSPRPSSTRRCTSRSRMRRCGRWSPRAPGSTSSAAAATRRWFASMVETGYRAGEVAVMKLSDPQLPAGTALLRRGKGGKGRSVPFGPQTTRALDRYLRARRTHRLAGTDALWLGDRGKQFSYRGLHKTLGLRARRAGIAGFHPNILRHTAAHRWLAAGGSEGGLMAVAGWTRPDMLVRYTRARASERAAEEARRLNLGEL